LEINQGYTTMHGPPVIKMTKLVVSFRIFDIWYGISVNCNWVATRWQ